VREVLDRNSKNIEDLCGTVVTVVSARGPLLFGSEVLVYVS
jgi:hypothetical protein